MTHFRLVLQEELAWNCLHLQGVSSPNCKNLRNVSMFNYYLSKTHYIPQELNVLQLTFFTWSLTAESQVRCQTIDVGFLVDKVLLGQVFLRVLRVFPVSIIPPKVRNFISFICHRCYIILANGIIVKWNRDAPRYCATLHRKLLRYIEGGVTRKYCIVWNFCSQTLMGTKLGWRWYIVVWRYLLLVTGVKFSSNASK